MTRDEIRKSFIEFYKSRGHVEIPSAPLVPLNDATTLFVSSGMQPLVPYLLGQEHPLGTRLVNSQKSFRADDIEEVGDNRHTTFFEMLGNWSLGDYFKQEQLPWVFEWLVEVVGLDPNRIYISVFAGDDTAQVGEDTEAVQIWKDIYKNYGIDANYVVIGTEENGYKVGMQGGRIFAYESKKNWWSRGGVPAKMPTGEIGGPDSEIFFDFGPEFATDPNYKDLEPHPNSDSGQFVEIGNSVFIQYIKQADGTFTELPKRNVDFGGGLERICAAVNNNPDVFLTDGFAPIIKSLEELSGKSYLDPKYTRNFRVIADHIRAGVMMITDGIVPDSKGQGYVLRRLLRRATRFSDEMGIKAGDMSLVAWSVVNTYRNAFQEVVDAQQKIVTEINNEDKKFRETLAKGMHAFSSGERDAFVLFTTYGFPVEFTQELIEESGEVFDTEDYKKKMEAHQEQSRTQSEGQFKGGLQDHSDAVIKLHTAHHLLLAALQKLVDPTIHQRGSNITGERLRMDFSFDRKVTKEELDKVEVQVNTWIQSGAKVERKEMNREDAMKIGAEMEFGAKYPDIVSVYMIATPDGEVVSKEFCGGPHVESLDILGTFKILKEEASSQGVRRIKAILQ